MIPAVEDEWVPVEMPENAGFLKDDLWRHVQISQGRCWRRYLVSLGYESQRSLFGEVFAWHQTALRGYGRWVWRTDAPVMETAELGLNLGSLGIPSDPPDRLHYNKV